MFDNLPRGAGLGLRRDIMAQLQQHPLDAIDFIEVAPENWISIGGSLGRQFKWFYERLPLMLHGLSLSIGGPEPLDEKLIQDIKGFIKQTGAVMYTEHLTYCSDDGHLYDLMPIPFTDEAVDYVARRIQRVQEILEQPIAMENASYYAAPMQQMSELEFITSVLEKADCKLLLDVNNVYVNAINHSYDPVEFLTALPSERVIYGHIAGHYDEADDLKVDTHGAPVKHDVWKLLDLAYRNFGVFPTLLERDFNFPAMKELIAEVEQIKSTQSKFTLEENISRA